MATAMEHVGMELFLQPPFLSSMSLLLMRPFTEIQLPVEDGKLFESKGDEEGLVLNVLVVVMRLNVLARIKKGIVEDRARVQTSLW